MLDLAPCPHCQRHVAITETGCPFCRGDLVGAAPRSLSLGGLSRAAVFAGATLAAACGGKPKVDANHAQVEAKPADAGVADAAVVPVIQGNTSDHNLPMPYGAPPARRRIV
jgi:hypothetical protein